MVEKLWERSPPPHLHFPRLYSGEDPKHSCHVFLCEQPVWHNGRQTLLIFDNTTTTFDRAWKPKRVKKIDIIIFYFLHKCQLIANLGFHRALLHSKMEFLLIVVLTDQSHLFQNTNMYFPNLQNKAKLLILISERLENSSYFAFRHQKQSSIAGIYFMPLKSIHAYCIFWCRDMLSCLSATILELYQSFLSICLSDGMEETFHPLVPEHNPTPFTFKSAHIGVTVFSHLWITPSSTHISTDTKPESCVCFWFASLHTTNEATA